MSTAYSFCPRLEIEEKFYEMPVDYEDIIQRVKVRTEEELQMETPKWVSSFNISLYRISVSNQTNV